jgi:HAMP domain-containing protein
MSSEKGDRFKSRRSRVLWEITALVVIVYVVGGLAAFLIAQSSYNRLAQKSTDKLIEEKAQTISSSYDYLAKAEMDILIEKFGVGNIDRAKLYAKLLAKEKTNLDPLQAFLIEETQGMKEAGLLGLQYIFMVIPPNTFSSNPITFVSNDPSLIYMTLPDEINQAIDNGDNWILMENGIPALGLEGEQLVTLTKIVSPVAPDVLISFIGITPMGTDVAEIKQFYSDEKKTTMTNYAIVTLISLVVIIILTFFGLRFLIRKRITKPIDILSAEAGEVMEGNLDIDVVVHEGGEFVELETAFKEMVESFRKYIARSTDGGIDEK